jgi:hypothetical protein
VAAASGAAVRDTTGRSYASAEVTLAGLHLSAIVLATAHAVAAGAAGLEAVVVDGIQPTTGDLDAVTAAGGSGVPVLVLNQAGTLAHTITT